MATMNFKAEGKKLKLGYKGAPPPKKHMNPRKKKENIEMCKFITEYNDNDEDAARKEISKYENADSDQEDLILTSWICGRNLPARIAKKVFRIGDYKYKRIKQMASKLRTGGQKPCTVTEEKIQLMSDFFSSLPFELGFPCPHKEIKHYISETVFKTWLEGFNMYLNFRLKSSSINPVGKTDLDSSFMSQKSEIQSEINFTGLDERVINDEDDDFSIDKLENEEVESIKSDEDEFSLNDSKSKTQSMQETNKLKTEGEYKVRDANRQKKSILESLISKLSYDEIKDLYSKKITGFSTWYKYKCIYFPNVALKKLKEDCCDTCMKYQLALEDPNVVESDKALITLALNMHLDHAKDQRRVIKDILKHSAREVLKNDGDFHLSCEEFDACLNNWVCNHESTTESSELFLSTVNSVVLNSTRRLVEVESHDYGGNLVMPWFGIRRPGLDYYLSNLNIYIFVMSNVTRYGTKHQLYVYDERAAGKDGDALCSLRFHYYMQQFIEQRNNNQLHLRARYLFIILDNCVGQNKSNAVMKLFSLLTVIGLYEGIILHYLEPGHSHGTPDVGVAHAKQSLKNDNYMVPEEMVRDMNTVDGINATYIDFRNASICDNKDYVFRSGWDQVMTSYVSNLPRDGKVTMKEYASSPESSSKTATLISYANLSVIKSDILKTLFPNCGGRLENVHYEDFCLPKASNRILSTRKISSLALKAKLFVTSEQRNYYPQIPEGITLAVSGDGNIVAKSAKRTKPKSILDSKTMIALKKHKSDSAEEQSSSSSSKTMLAYFKKLTPTVKGTQSSTSIQTSTSTNVTRIVLQTPNTISIDDPIAIKNNLNSVVDNQSDANIDSNDEIVTPTSVVQLNELTLSQVATENLIHNVPIQSSTKNASAKDEVPNSNLAPVTTRQSFISPSNLVQKNLFQDLTSSSKAEKPTKVTKRSQPLTANITQSLKETFSGFDLNSDGFQMQTVRHYKDPVDSSSKKLTFQNNPDLNNSLSTITISKRLFFERYMSAVSIDEVMSLPWVNISVNPKEVVEFKQRALVVVYQVLGTVIGNEHLSAAFTKPRTKCYDVRHMYLEKQYDCACFFHCLFAVLGESLHAMFHFNNTFILALDASINLPIGTEDLLEPVTMSEFGEGTDPSVIDQLRSTVETIPSLCPAVSHAMFGNGNIERFVSHFNVNFQHEGVSKTFAHRLFCSLGNPQTTQDNEDIYIGAKRLLENEVVDAVTLLAEFNRSGSNIIVFCCELNREHGAGVFMHYVVVWLLSATKCVLYYDPMTGLESPRENTLPVSGIYLPLSLMNAETMNSVIYIGNRRCAFYFNAALDNNGVILPQSQMQICNNLNTRIRILVEDVFGVKGIPIRNVYTLCSKTFDEDAIYQTRKISVRPSLLRSIHTGNLIGNSLFVKRGQIINKDEDIGHWEGKLLALTAEERKATVEKNPTRQFYSVGLKLGAAVLESIRMANNLPINEYERYFGELDCYDEAMEGLCLMSYANTIRDVYHEYGFRVAANAIRPIQSGCTKPVLRASIDIEGDTEILWAYGQHVRMPKTVEEERFSRIGGNHEPNSWAYEFTMQSVIDYLTLFSVTNALEFEKASKIVNSAMSTKKLTDELTKHPTGKVTYLIIKAEDIARCRIVPDVNTRRKNSTEDTFYYANDTIIDMYFGRGMMLDALDRYLCDQNSARKRSLVLHRSYIPNLHTWKDRRFSRSHKQFVISANSGFFDLDKVFLPVHNNLHWTLYVIFPIRRHVVFYDTLNLAEPDSLQPNDIFEYIEDECAAIGKVFNRNAWKYYRAAVKLQGNGLDCGFCVIKYAIIVLHNLPLDLNVPMNEFRVQCAYEILDGYMSLHPSRIYLVHYKYEHPILESDNLQIDEMAIQNSSSNLVSSEHGSHGRELDFYDYTEMQQYTNYPTEERDENTDQEFI